MKYLLLLLIPFASALDCEVEGMIENGKMLITETNSDDPIECDSYLNREVTTTAELAEGTEIRTIISSSDPTSDVVEVNELRILKEPEPENRIVIKSVEQKDSMLFLIVPATLILLIIFLYFFYKKKD